MTAQQPATLVTGASWGIGREVALRLTPPTPELTSLARPMDALRGRLWHRCDTGRFSDGPPKTTNC
jgi:short-subunit dehydrogenase